MAARILGNSGFVSYPLFGIKSFLLGPHGCGLFAGNKPHGCGLFIHIGRMGAAY